MRSSLFLPLVVLLFSCTQASKPPANLIPVKKMEQVLLDVNLAETYSAMIKDTLHPRQGTKNPDSLTVYYKEIFQHHNITAEQFSTSLGWYKGHPDELDSMYNNMIPKITAWQSQPAATPPPANAPAAHK